MNTDMTRFYIKEFVASLQNTIDLFMNLISIEDYKPFSEEDASFQTELQTDFWSIHYP